jgi:hypothetical protein
MKQAKWITSQRVDRVRTFAVSAPAKDVFPLLCPVREYEWIPSWVCTMAYSKSGAAELDAVFQTTGPLRKKIVWALITYEPNRFVEYLMVSGRDMVVRLSIALVEDGGRTTITWRMLFTGTSLVGRKLLSTAFTEEKYGEMLSGREKELRHFLETGAMLGTRKGASH